MEEKVKLVLDEKGLPRIYAEGVYFVRVPLTDDEYAGLAKDLGERVIKKIRIEEEKKEVVSDYNEKIKGEEKEIERLSFYIKSGEREETMELQVRKNHYENRLEFVNADDEIMATLPMRPEDKQVELELRKKKLMGEQEPSKEDAPNFPDEDEAVLDVTESGWAKPKKGDK